MKEIRSFIVTMSAMFMLFVLAYVKDVDIEYSFSTIVAVYVLGRTASKASHVWAASKDPNVDTKSVIEKIDHGD